jgi:hypothetical protein
MRSCSTPSLCRGIASTQAIQLQIELRLNGIEADKGRKDVFAAFARSFWVLADPRIMHCGRFGSSSVMAGGIARQRRA